ncbi:LysE family translocator [Phormidium tenue FACHB-886]|nr:LysE family translocator [Phormidium tenue FACHB-886]
MIDSQILAFVGLASVLTMTPGADTMLVMRNTLRQGRRAGMLTVLGGCGGILIHAALSGLGLSIILVRSAAIYETVKFAGAAYLIWLGLQSLWRAFHRRAEARQVNSPQSGETRSAYSCLRDGLVSNVLNPKTALFYLALLPQFVHFSNRVLLTSLLLAAIHIAMRFVWLSFITILIQQVRLFMNRPLIQQSLEAMTGTVLCAFGLRLALAHRE